MGLAANFTQTSPQTSPKPHKLHPNFTNFTQTSQTSPKLHPNFTQTSPKLHPNFTQTSRKLHCKLHPNFVNPGGLKGHRGNRTGVWCSANIELTTKLKELLCIMLALLVRILAYPRTFALSHGVKSRSHNTTVMI